MVADGLAVGLMDLVAHRTRTEGYQKANNAGKASARPARRAAKRGTTLGEGENAGHVLLRVGHRTGDTVIYSLT